MTMGVMPGFTNLATRGQNTTFASYTPEPEYLPYPPIEIGLGVLGIFIIIFFAGLLIWWRAIWRRADTDRS